MLREEYFKILRSIHFDFNSFLSVNDRVLKLGIGKEKNFPKAETNSKNLKRRNHEVKTFLSFYPSFIYSQFVKKATLSITIKILFEPKIFFGHAKLKKTPSNVAQKYSEVPYKRACSLKFLYIFSTIIANFYPARFNIKFNKSALEFKKESIYSFILVCSFLNRVCTSIPVCSFIRDFRVLLITLSCPNDPNRRIHAPKCGLQTNCI